VPFHQALALTLAGGFAGLAGVIEVIGVQHRLLQGITSGYGFTGIVAALFGGLHPIGAIPASFLFGVLLVGADKMQRATQVPSALIGTLLGLIVMFVVGSAYLSRRWAARRAVEVVSPDDRPSEDLTSPHAGADQARRSAVEPAPARGKRGPGHE